MGSSARTLLTPDCCHDRRLSAGFGRGWPQAIAQRHLECFAESGDDGLLFVGPLGGRLRRSNFRDLWLVALKDAGIDELHLHDLRHTGNMLAAATGASLRELMQRMGHSSSRAAMIYQHASRDRDEAIAAAMGTALSAAREDARRSRSGTQRARGRGKAS
jgi:integrase